MEKPLTSIVPKLDGYEVTDNEKTIFFPNAELMQVGCRNCIWKLNGQCPHNLIGEEEKKEGICDEMLHFLTDLADKNDTLTAIWEKFHIYKARLQESADYKDFRQLEDKIKIMEKTAHSEEDYKELDTLRMNKTAAKMWWVKLNQHVIMSMQKIVDREVKASGVGKLPGIMNAKTINQQSQRSRMHAPIVFPN